MANLVQLADVKTYLQIASSITTDDALLAQHIVGYSAAVLSYCRQHVDGIYPQNDIFDGGLREMVLTMRPISAIAALVDRSMNIAQEQFGVGNNSQTVFPFTLQQPPAFGNPEFPGLIQIVAGQFSALDDGNGNFAGNGFSAGAISYGNGVGSVTLSAPPGAGVALKAAYVPLTAIVDPSTYEIDTGAGLVYPIPDPPTNFPIPAGRFDFLDGEARWGRGRRRWQALYTNGYATVPADVQLACLILIAGRYNRRDDLGEETVGDYSYHIEPGDSGWTPHVERLLGKYHELQL